MPLPQRIVSLVPSQTELLHDLGLEARVVGITKFCCHPQHWLQEKTRIGGTKTVDTAKVLGLQPDLIIANKEENEREQVEYLAQYCPVYTSDVYNFESALEMMETIGALTGTNEAAMALIRRIQARFAQFDLDSPLKKALYLIWRKPFMAAGGDTFINDMMRYAGYTNVLSSRLRYPECTVPEIADLAPEVILLSSEPYPFQESHIRELAEICPQADIRLVDGEMYSWYGSRLQYFEGRPISIF